MSSRDYVFGRIVAIIEEECYKKHIEDFAVNYCANGYFYRHPLSSTKRWAKLLGIEDVINALLEELTEDELTNKALGDGVLWGQYGIMHNPRGGARPGTGRKKQGDISWQVRVTAEEKAALKAYLAKLRNTNN